MSNRRNQRLPEEIYVRRRVAAAVIILVLVALLVWGLVALNRGSDDEGGTSPAPTTTAEASPASDASAASAAADETTETVEAVGGADPAETTDTTDTESSAAVESSESSEASASSETTSPEATTEPKDSCGLSDLRITATSDQPSYAPDVQPTFYMTVDNPTAADCEINLDDNVLRFEVYDMKTNQRMWADTDCYPSVEDGTRTFPAGEERHFEAVWSRLGSAPGQCNNRQPVPDGSYYLHGVIGQNPSNAHSFNLG
ncbi:hypothetical protein [Corynebacterium halotolerans]|uniref:Uncharacterized protein n=1 Tax=Corynebacterium halotolerans YIM 70093 = DSM 44683 TaxID=1121362 RepID=M1P9S8_9CORY|nr:hypothetical protein [Corynebacterium halotolerans]AGF73421.1 hypothetical protein A605_12125 [Corynebacterium halotolerans YIM 70093 = DSM 44683]